MHDYNKSKRVAMLFPYVPAYREAIYRKIDEAFDTKWFLCKNAIRPLKFLNYDILRDKDVSMTERCLKGGIHYINGCHPKLFKDFDTVIFSGNIRNLSYWKLLFWTQWGKKRPKLLLWTHGWYGKENWLERIIKKIYYKRADGLLLYGEHARNIMINEGFDPKRLFLIKNSLNYEKQLALRKTLSKTSLYNEKFSNTYPVIIFIGRLTPEKRLDLIISALGVLKRAGKYYNLLFIGEGVVKSDLMDLAVSEEIEKNVLFWGECYDERINAELIYNADLCVSPGNVGLTAIHALMFGCPVITNDDFTHQGPEFEAIKQGETGQFFTKGSIDALASAIEKWFDGPGKNRDVVRLACYKEIDACWNPCYQMKVLKQAIQ